MLYDALHQVTGTTTQFSGVPDGTRAVALPDNGFENYFLSVFGKPQNNSACECERSSEATLAQALHLLNAPEVQAKLSNAVGRPARFATDTARTDEAKIDELYWTALAQAHRRPRNPVCIDLFGAARVSSRQTTGLRRHRLGAVEHQRVLIQPLIAPLAALLTDHHRQPAPPTL